MCLTIWHNFYFYLAFVSPQFLLSPVLVMLCFKHKFCIWSTNAVRTRLIVFGRLQWYVVCTQPHIRDWSLHDRYIKKKNKNWKIRHGATFFRKPTNVTLTHKIHIHIFSFNRFYDFQLFFVCIVIVISISLFCFFLFI